MGAKWERTKQWDERVFPAWAWPIKWLLRTFSEIRTAVVLLTLVVLYGILASVPIGLLALIPSYAVYAATALLAIAIVAVGPTALVRRLLLSASRETRFAVSFILLAALSVSAIALWSAFIWPLLRYNPAINDGFRFFPEFVATYEAITLRRLPALEMSELEFYSWWPMRLLLILFVINMVTATVRRIEFIFPNIGVLTVHTGIVLIALGSLHYKSLKQEGDALLIASSQGPGVPGPAVSTFYDRTKPALWINQRGRGWEQREMPGLPRYNDYGVSWTDRTLNLTLPATSQSTTDENIQIRIVGFGAYVELVETWAPDSSLPAQPNPLCEVALITTLPDPDTGSTDPRESFRVRLAASSALDRLTTVPGVYAIEYVPADAERRWRDVISELPNETEHALVVGVGEARRIVPIKVGQEFTAGQNTIRIQQILPSPPFPLITAGYQGAETSVVIAQIITPDGATYQRYIHHRFPEIDQDIVGHHNDGRPIRRDADPALQLRYIDASILQVYLHPDGAVAVRAPAGPVQITHPAVGDEIPLAPRVTLRIINRWQHAVRRETPVPVPEEQRQRNFEGTYGAASIAVEVSAPNSAPQTIWIPFAQFLGVGLETERVVHLPDGRDLAFAFSRLSHGLPSYTLRLVDFEMIPYEHSDLPRDFVSNLQIIDNETGKSETRITRLNRPLMLRAKFQTSADRPWLANMIGRAVSLVAPNRYKFSQASWDAEGWRRTSEETAKGLRDRPVATFTVLGVGNNPGIHIIAAGGVMVSVGIPWAFYVKPWIMRRRKQKIQRELAKVANHNSNDAPAAAKEKLAVPVEAAAL